ncbi:hypothetical protein [Prauserella endophytica]|uniref:Exonuclease domain-containing protein n=1 Tax=Prauserella endophytica TaxID=1592324 RepID=A0ABY2S089_9PSEU|nr:hypothetical protein [Prauserella endophytica]TKG67033.1 hypothetical protein FCN18_24310 [Prauserella endophytica]
MSLCFIDTETTGVHPDRQVWEIAMIRDEPGYGEASFFVDVDLSNADPFGLKVGGFYERHPQGRFLSARTHVDERFPDPFDPIARAKYQTRDEAAETVARWTHGCHLVGAVPDFDARTLDPLLRKHGLIPAWHYHLIDIEAMAAGWLLRAANALYDRSEGADDIVQRAQDMRDTALAPWKSDDLARACGVEPPSEEERHTALGDARWVKRWYEAITGGGDR